MDSIKERVKKELAKIIISMDADVDAALVEGKRDARALEKMGFSKPVISCSSLTPSDVAERVVEIGAKNIALLTDYDSQGKEMEAELSQILAMRGIRIKSLHRKKIKEVFNTRNMKTIEAMNNL